MDEAASRFFGAPGAMTALPDDLQVRDLPGDVGGLRTVVQGLVLHRDLAWAYGVAGDDLRLDEQHLRSAREVLARARELRDLPLGVERSPVNRVLGICSHFALLHTAFLRGQGVPARMRCGFGGYFERDKWLDHWITEWWDGERWVRHDAQIDEQQAEAFGLDFDPYDQPAGRFLTGAEAWVTARSGEIAADRFGIWDMWGLAYIAGNVLSDFACLNKVELLPWDDWGIRAELDPHVALTEETMIVIDDIAQLALDDDHAAIAARYTSDDQLRVPADITSFVDGQPVSVRLGL